MNAFTAKVHVAAHVLWWLRLRKSLYMSNACTWCRTRLQREVTR